MHHISVVVHASDPMTREGVAVLLATCHDLVVLPSGSLGYAPQIDVVVFATETVDDELLRTLRSTTQPSRVPTLVIAQRVNQKAAEKLKMLQLTALLNRRTLTAPQLAATVRRLGSPAHEGRSEHVLHDSLTTSNTEFDDREVDILRLIARGQSTLQVAGELNYSEGTVKNVLTKINKRLGLRSRSQAIAIAIRAGAI